MEFTSKLVNYGNEGFMKNLLWNNKCYVGWWWWLLTSLCVVMTSSKHWLFGQLLPWPTWTRQPLICFPQHFDFWFSFLDKMWTADITVCCWLRGWIRLRGNTVIMSERYFYWISSIKCHDSLPPRCWKSNVEDDDGKGDGVKTESGVGPHPLRPHSWAST